MNEMGSQGLPPQYGDASFGTQTNMPQNVGFGAGVRRRTTCDFSARYSYVTCAIQIILKKNKSLCYFISSRQKTLGTGGRWMKNRERLENSLREWLPGLPACKKEVARTCFVGRC